MTRNQVILLGLGAGALTWVYLNRLAAEQAASTVEAAFMGWANTNEGPTWVPIINSVESQLGIPPNLLARMAFQESSFLPDVIDGTTASSAGALGILQLMPQYFSTVQVPIPFSTSDTQAQIEQAGQQLVALYNQFGDWGDALAGYNAGAGTIQAVLAGTASLPAETYNYVTEILADVPVPGNPPGVLNA